MSSFDTSLGGPAEFRTTIWSDVLAAGNPAHPETRQRLDILLRRYWKPAYLYIRLSWKIPVEDAKDLTQAFFARMIEKEYWSVLHPDRGSFRGYLRQSLKHFLINARKHDELRKPTSGAFSIDTDDLEGLLPSAPDETPEQAYDRVWFKCVMENATAALKAELERDGKTLQYQVFSAYCFDAPAGIDRQPDEGPTYAELGAKFGIKESDVHNLLTFSRQRIRELVLESIRDYTATPADLERELRDSAGR